MTLLWIALGGAAGSVTRYLLYSTVQRVAHVNFPLGTLVVNIAGSLIVGLLTGFALNTQTHPMLRPALIVGFCGGFTTFSAFSMETVSLIEGGAVAKAAIYAGASVGACIAAAAVGFMLTRPAAT